MLGGFARKRQTREIMKAAMVFKKKMYPDKAVLKTRGTETGSYH